MAGQLDRDHPLTAKNPAGHSGSAGVNGFTAGNWQEKLHEVDRQIRRAVLRRGLGWTLTVFVSCWAVSLLADWLWNLPAGVRAGLLIVTLAVTTITALFRVVLPLRRRLSNAELAAVVEQSYPELDGRLISLAELQSPETEDRRASSNLFVTLLERQTTRALGKLDLRETVSTGRAKRWLLAGGGAALLLVLPWLFAPRAYGELWSRFWSPVTGSKTADDGIRVINGDRTVLRGSDVTITAKLSPELTANRTPTESDASQAELVLQPDLPGETRQPLRFAVDENRVSGTIARVQESCAYQIVSGEASSQTHRIAVVDRPAIITATMTALPPAYTDQEAVTFDGMLGDLTVFEDSLLQVRLQFNRTMHRAEWVWLEAPTEQNLPAPVAPPADENATATPLLQTPPTQSMQLVLADDGRSATLEFLAQRSGQFALLVTDEHGFQNAAEPFRKLIIRRDQPPAFFTIQQPNTVIVASDARLPFLVEVRDDVAVTQADVLITINGVEPPQTMQPTAELMQPVVELDFELALAEHNVKSGDEVRVQLRAVDNRPQPAGAQTVLSEPWVFLVEDNAAGNLEELAERQQTWRDTLQQLRDEVAAAADDAEQLKKQADTAVAAEQPVNADAALDQLADRERQAAEGLRKLAAEMRSRPLFERLADALESQAAEPLQQAADEARELPRQPDPQKPESLKQNADKVRAVAEDLALRAEQLEELGSLEQDLQQIPEMVRAAEDLAEATEKLDAPDQAPAENPAEVNMPPDDQPEEAKPAEPSKAAQRQQLAQRHRELSNQLNRLVEQHSQLQRAAEEAGRKRVNDVAEQARELAQAQDDLADQTADTPSVQDDMPPAEPVQPAGDDASKNPPAGNPPAETPPSDDAKPEQNPADNQPPASLPNAENATTPTTTNTKPEPAGDAGDPPSDSKPDAPTDTKPSAKPDNNTDQRVDASTDKPATADKSDGTDEKSAAAEPAASKPDETQPLSDEPSANKPQDKPSDQQQKIAQQIAQLKRDLQRALEQAGIEQPATEDKPAGKGSEAARSATRSFEAAESAAKQAGDNPSSAAQKSAAKQASEALKQAAKSLQDAQSESQDAPRSLVPAKLGDQVAEARRQLQAAGQKIGDVAPEPQAGDQPADQPGTSTDNDKPPADNSQSSPAKPSDGTPPADENGMPQEGDSDGQPPTPNVDGSNAQQPNEQQPGQQPGGQSPAGQQPDSQGQPRSQGKPSNGASSGKSPAGEHFRNAAEALRQAANQAGAQSGKGGRGRPGQQNAQPGQQSENGDGRGTQSEIDPELLGGTPGQRARREWGQLPGQLKTEILQGSQNQPLGDYRQFIEWYSRELQQSQTPPVPGNQP